MGQKRIRKFFTLFVAGGFLTAILIQPVIAEDLDSTTFRILDFSFGDVGSIESSSNNELLLSGAEFTRDTRFLSSNYALGTGVANTWKASVPIVECFETVTDGSTSCSDPDIAAGMVQICGAGGCYNRARFEIDGSDNPSDTLYSAQITTDPSWNTFDFIDASTFLIEPLGNHDINDYQTETYWESTVSSFNIFNLDPNTTYYIRLTALHGDFTETEPGPSITATTAYPQISVDIDIADSGGTATETAFPYSVSLGTLTVGLVSTAQDLIWLDLDTNLNGGAETFVRSVNDGLFSSTASFTLNSNNADLSSVSGFGLQNNSVTETYLGSLAAFGDFTSGGENVGGVPQILYSKQILNTSQAPIYAGRASFFIKARPSESAPSAADYTDTFIFTVAGDY